jgi:hypothetical protein
MDKRSVLLKLLWEAEHKVAEQNDHLTVQYGVISRLANKGQDTAEAVSLLSQFLQLRTHLEHYRDQLKLKLDNLR